MILLASLTCVVLCLELKRVQVVTRHGARTTLSPFPAETEDWICDGIGTVAFSTLQAGSTAQVAHFLAVYNTPHPTLKGGSCIQGILTKEGRLQHEQLGQSFRQKYGDFLPRRFTQEAFYIRSTNYERTKQSAMSFLIGLYPELGKDSRYGGYGKVMPVIHIAETDDWLDLSNCPSLDEARKYFSKDSEYVQLLKLHQESLERLSELAGFDSTVSWGVIRDNLAARTAMGIPLMKGFTEADVEESRKMHDAHYRLVYCRSDPDERKKYLRPAIGRFLKLLTNEMSDDQRVEKFMLYSAHDTTLAPLMGALTDPEKYDCGQPYYASSLTFELYHHESDRYIRFIYNGEPFVPPFCTSTTVADLDNLCPFGEYVAGVSEFYSMDFEEECYHTQWPDAEQIRVDKSL